MAEVQSRSSARGRPSGRGRGGHSSRGRGGGRSHAASNGDATTTIEPDSDDEMGQLKKKYKSEVATIREMFPSWSDEDIVFALQETDGDLEIAVERITEGTISQWGEVSKKKEKKAKETPLTEVSGQNKSARDGRDASKGPRGRGVSRGADRGSRGGGRGRGQTRDAQSAAKESVVDSVPTVDPASWEDKPQQPAPAWDAQPGPGNEWAASTDNENQQPTSSIIPDGVKKSWASIFAPAPAAKKAAAKPQQTSDVQQRGKESGRTAAAADEMPPIEALATPSAAEVATPPVEEPAIQITPSKDELTESNLEQVPDESQPAPTATAASTAASSWDPRNGANMTPYAGAQGRPANSRAPTSGYQASALKATAVNRTPSFQRRVLDQEEAVRMPGNREVDRAAVQFGAFNLGGGGDDDVDGDREEPETRTQPPQHSPVAPRASLPPTHQAANVGAEGLPTPKQAAGLPAPAASTDATAGAAESSGLMPAQQGNTQASQDALQQGQHGAANYTQYGSRYAQAGSQDQGVSQAQKPYESLTQQQTTSTQSPFEHYQGQQTQAHQQHTSQNTPFSSAPSDYSAYYPTDPQHRNAYNQYYQQQYGLHQASQGQTEGSGSQQRAYGGYNGPQGESSQYGQAQTSSQQVQGRFATAGENQTSGHSTPNQTQQSSAQTGHPQQHQGAGNYPYGHPYYSSPYYNSYMNYAQGYAGGNYGAGPYGGKAGHHNQPYQGYGMSPNQPYEHASSPANAGFGASAQGRDSSLGGNAGSDHGRGVSAQTSHPSGIGGSGGAFGATHDAFARGGSYQGQSQSYAGQQGAQSSTDDLKPFGDPKAGSGPSPSLAQAGRPGSAANAASASGLPPPQSQQGYGGYPSHLHQQGHGVHGNQGNSQYGGLGGAGMHHGGSQGHHNSQYGGYQAFGNNAYYANSSQGRGGWGGNYGH